MVLFENVGLRYGLGPEVLRDVNLRIEPHSSRFLTGPMALEKLLAASAVFVAASDPIGALLISDKLADGLTAGTHGSTFGGNPLASAAPHGSSCAR